MRRKAIAAVIDRPKTLPIKPLTAAQDRERVANPASVRSVRSACTVGDMRSSETTCRQGHECVDVLIGIEEHGGQTWQQWTCFPDAPNDW